MGFGALRSALARHRPTMSRRRSIPKPSTARFCLRKVDYFWQQQEYFSAGVLPPCCISGYPQ